MKQKGAFTEYFEVRGNGVAHADINRMMKDPNLKARLKNMTRTKDRNPVPKNHSTA